MKIGYFGFNNGPAATPEHIANLMGWLEDARFESAWTGEHVVVIDPQEAPSPVPPELPMLDTVVALTFAAAHSSTLKLGSGIILLAQRNPVVLAKSLSSIDVLSNGRLIFGVGVGYVPREFEVIGVPYEERGARVDDHIEAIRALWTEQQPDFDGRFTRIQGIQQHPHPVQKPHPPIIIGGMSPSAYRRAVACGDGWYGFAQDEAATAASIAGLKEASADSGRFEALEISVTPRGPVDAARVRAFEDLGVHRLTLMPPLGAGATGDDVRRFIEETSTELGL